MNNQTVQRKFGLRDKIGYMFGDFGNDFTFVLASMFLMKFYTDVMGVPGATVGLMMMLARFVDAFTDIAMGHIVDRSKPTAKGKFLPWIRRMCGPVAVASLLMYASWMKDMPMAVKVTWMSVTYLLWGSVFYTSINIPYGSMASAISSDPKHANGENGIAKNKNAAERHIVRKSTIHPGGAFCCCGLAARMGNTLIFRTNSL